MVLTAEHRGALGGGDIAVRIAEVAEGAVDRTQAVGAARDHHGPCPRRMPLIGPEISGDCRSLSSVSTP